jgi:hypothetical protein
MEPIKFAREFLKHLNSLIPQSQWGEWTYTGKSQTAYPTPGGPWTNEGFEFSCEEYYFILRSIPESVRGSYVVVESHNLEGQLANLRLENRNVYSDLGSTSILKESYSMTIGHGKRRKEEVRQAFEEIGLESDIITRIDDTLPNWNKSLIEILQWSVLREQVKIKLKESISQFQDSILEPLLIPDQYILMSDSSEIYNDIVFEHEAFDILNTTFTFVIYPKSKYWRFGLRFSENEKIDFDRTNPPRHLNSKYKEIHLCVGHPATPGQWDHPNRVEFAFYNFEQTENTSKRCENYEPLSPIILKIKHETSSNYLIVSYSSKNCTESETRLEFGNYNFFQVSAWADGIPFNLSFTIGTSLIQLPNDDRPVSQTIFIESSSDFRIRNNFDGVIGVKELANEMVSMITNLNDDKGNMIGVFGQWGRGKTFLWNRMVDNINVRAKNYSKTKKTLFQRLKQNREELAAANKSIWQIFNVKNKVNIAPKKFEFVEFHAWKYQDTPASWAYLYESLSDKFLKKKWRGSFWRRVSLNLVRLGYSKIILFCISLIISLGIALIIPHEAKLDFIKWLLSTFGIVTLIEILHLYFSHKPKALALFKEYSQKVSFRGYLGIQAEIQKEIVFLLRTWIKETKVSDEKILIFVDDIDRCDEQKIMAIIDSFKVMLEDPNIANRIIVIMAIDERVLKMAVKNKYFDLVNKSTFAVDRNPIMECELEKLSKEYLDKLFIAGVKLGQLADSERKAIFDKITEERVHFRSKEMKQNLSENLIQNGNDNAISPNPEGDLGSGDSEDDEDLMQEIIYGDEKYEIDENEYHHLLDALQKNPNMTPRAIRIFYYRYLLAKKIIKLRFIKNTKLYFIWNSGKIDKSILSNLILYYSRMEIIQNELSQEINAIQTSNDLTSANSIIEKEVCGRSYKIDALLYKELLNIIEMVVPY